MDIMRHIPMHSANCRTSELKLNLTFTDSKHWTQWIQHSRQWTSL